jgi:hypothetical protein
MKKTKKQLKKLKQDKEAHKLVKDLNRATEELKNIRILRLAQNRALETLMKVFKNES